MPAIPSALLRPTSDLSPAQVQELSQLAPSLLASLPSTIGASTMQSVVAPTENAEVWIAYENLLLLCLRSGNLGSARESLRRLIGRFGKDNDRIMALDGLFRESEATSTAKPGSGDKALLDVLKSYDAILAEDGSNIPIHKRRAALLRSLGRIPEAVSALVALLDFSPTDAEAWAELADVYLSQGMYAQAIYALEEVLVLMPNAWNMHARLGEVQYMAAVAVAGGSDAATQQKHLAESLKRFCRSIELCDNYLRGYYGLNLLTAYALEHAGKWPKRNTDAEGFVLPDTATLQRLSLLATEKLSEIVRRGTAKEPHWSGYDDAELAAARKLLA